MQLTQKMIEDRFKEYDYSGKSMSERFSPEMIAMLFELWKEPKFFDKLPTDVFRDKIYIKIAIRLIQDKFKAELEEIFNDN